MRVQRQLRPLLWIALPALLATAAAKSGPPAEPPVTPLGALNGDDANYQEVTGASTLQSSAGKEIGTKDAPVDGFDGKPHAGPWVGMDAETKKKLSSADDAVPESVKKLEKQLSRSEAGKKGAVIPDTNDGVMDDHTRPSPEEGTTGTEGGVSEKNKKQRAKEAKTGAKLEKKPQAPKEAPRLPQSEEQLIKDKASKGAEGQEAQQGAEKPKGAVGLEEQKPTDLPSTPKKNVPVPETAPPKKSSWLADALPYSERPARIGDEETQAASTGSIPQAIPSLPDAETLIQPLHSFILSLIMIVFSEVGDKTFLVAALMAMRHDRILVFSAAFSALFVMTVLSAVLGHAVPSLLPRRLVSSAAAALFFVFGAKLLREGLGMPRDSGVGEEMKEVEDELEEKEHLARINIGRRKRGDSDIAAAAGALEAGRGRSAMSTTTTTTSSKKKTRLPAQLPAPPESPHSSDTSREPSPSSSSSPLSAVAAITSSSSSSLAAAGASLASLLAGLNNLLSLVLSPAWVQTFVMTFLGEWGDRSQIATIAMAAGQDYWWVTAGAVVGHAACTGVAVVGGRALAGRVSLRVVTLGGAAAFLFFGLVYTVESIYW